MTTEDKVTIAPPPVCVLVVDDETGARGVATRFLEAHGAEVMAVSSGAEAVEAARSRPFDVLLTDIMMPGMNGFETAEMIRKIDPHISIVAMSGSEAPGTKRAALKLGAVHYLPKPFRAAEVADVIKKAAELSRRRRTPEAPRGQAAGRVLVLEDHPAMRNSVVKRLRLDGFLAEGAGSVAEAVAAWPSGAFDIGLFDIHLPDGTGEDAARTIQEKNPTANIVFMTGEATKEEIGEMVQLSTGGCLRKPLDLGKIGRILSSLIEFGRMTEQRQAKIDSYRKLSPVVKVFHRAGHQFRMMSRSGELKRAVLGITVAVIIALGIFSIMGQAQRSMMGRLVDDSGHASLSIWDMYDKIAGYLDRDEKRELRK